MRLSADFLDTCQGAGPGLYLFLYCGLVEIGTEIVETALTFVPALTQIPVLGRIIIFLFPGAQHGNQTQAILALQSAVEKKTRERRSRRQRAAKRVIKGSEAMQCVEEALGNGRSLLAMGRGIVNTVLGRDNASFADITIDQIYTCIESKLLPQTGRRAAREGRFQHRPSRGHGFGRGGNNPRGGEEDEQTEPPNEG